MDKTHNIGVGRVAIRVSPTIGIPPMATGHNGLLALLAVVECPAIHETEIAEEAIANAPARLKRAILAAQEMFNRAPTDSEEEAVLAQVLADLTDLAVALYLPDEDGEGEDEDEGKGGK